MIYRANLQKKPQEGTNKKNEFLGFKPAEPMRPRSMFHANEVPANDTTLETEIPLNPEIAQPMSAPPGTKPKGKFKFNFKLLVILAIVFVVVFVGLFAYDRISNYSSRVQQYDEAGNLLETCNNILNPKCWTDAFKPQLKQSDGFTSALIIGVDTRTGKGSLMNTDSLIVATFNHKTQEVMLTSIPRDFWSHSYGAKINAVYAYTYQQGRAKYNDEFYYLKEEISKIIGKPLQYTAKVRFEGVIGLVDQLGGVEVCLDNGFTAKYPNDNARPTDKQWLSFEFPKGCQTLNGDMALVYSRFRHLYRGPSALESDFSRAHRQQEVINAIKDKLVSDNSSIEQKAESYWALFQSFDEIIDVDVSFEDLLAGLAYINTFDKKPINIVLDPNFGGLNRFIYTDSNPTQGYTIKARSKDYKNIQEEMNKIWKFSAFYKETPNLLVRNQTGEKELPKDSAAAKLKNETAYYNQYNVMNEPKSDKLAGIHIFDFTNGAKPKSAEFLKTFLGVSTIESMPEDYGITLSNKKEDFLIVVGPAELAPAVTVAPTE